MNGYALLVAWFEDVFAFVSLFVFGVDVAYLCLCDFLEFVELSFVEAPVFDVGVCDFFDVQSHSPGYGFVGDVSEPVLDFPSFGVSVVFSVYLVEFSV